MVGRVVEVTFLLVLTFLVLTNAGGFSMAMSSLAGAYSTAVRTLQGFNPNG
jgi:hypothetical protein